MQSRRPALAVRWKYPSRLTDPVHDEVCIWMQRDGGSIRGDVSDRVNALQWRVRQLDCVIQVPKLIEEKILVGDADCVRVPVMIEPVQDKHKLALRQAAPGDILSVDPRCCNPAAEQRVFFCVANAGE